MRVRVLHLLAAGAAAVGAVASGLMLRAHLLGDAGALPGDCGAAGGGCAAVLHSRWSVFPPSPYDGSPDVALDGLPVAGLGLVWFALLASWSAFVGPAGRSRDGHDFQVLALAAAACLGSAAFVVLMATRIPGWCTFCLAAHGANFVALACLAAAYRARGAGEADGPPPAVPHRLAALAAGGALAAAAWLGLDAAARRAALDALSARLADLEEDASRLEISYFTNDEHTRDEDARARFDALLRPDDPGIAPVPGPHMTLVVFGDAECPGCHRFDALLAREVLPAFAGHLRVVYKHFPLSDVHPHAEAAARALEAGRLQGAYGELRARLAAERERLGAVDWRALAGELDLDVARFEADRTSDAVATRIAEDVAAGRALGVDSTPAVFLNRRRVDPSARDLPGFWRLRAQALRLTVEARGEAW